MLEKPAVPVVPQNLVCVALGMVQLIINVPCSLQGYKTSLGLGRVLYFVISFGCCREVVSVQTGTEVDEVFFITGVALKSLLSFLFSDHPTPGAFSVLSWQRTCPLSRG